MAQPEPWPWPRCHQSRGRLYESVDGTRQTTAIVGQAPHVAPWPGRHHQGVSENFWRARLEPEEGWTHTLLTFL